MRGITIASVALALLLSTALALAGFLATSIQGFAAAGGLTAAGPLHGPLVTRHVGYAIPTVLLSLFSQSMVIFYFIGTGKLVKEEIASYPESHRAAVLAALRDLKKRTSPAATLALLSAIAVFVLGGGAHTRALPAWVHLGSALAAVALHAWALAAEWSAFADNHRLMADPRGYRLPSPRHAGRSLRETWPSATAGNEGSGGRPPDPPRAGRGGGS